MPELYLGATRTVRIERVRSKISNISHIKRYDSPEKWEEIINLLMLTSARDEDAKMYQPDATEHVSAALESLAKSGLLEDIERPHTRIGREILIQKMATVIVDTADSVDACLDMSAVFACIILILFFVGILTACVLTALVRH